MQQLLDAFESNGLILLSVGLCTLAVGFMWRHKAKTAKQRKRKRALKIFLIGGYLLFAALLFLISVLGK